MWKAGAWCLVVLLISSAETRPSEYESVSAEGATNNEVVPTTTEEDIKVVTSTQGTEDVTIEYIQVTTSAGATEGETSTGNSEIVESTEVATSAESTEVTTGTDETIGVISTTKDSEEDFEGTTDYSDLFKSSKDNEHEIVINSSVILPCFKFYAGRKITPFIARPYNYEAELEAWTKAKLPSKLAFVNQDNEIHFTDLAEGTPPSSPVVKEYEDKVSVYLYTRHGNGDGVKLDLNARHILKSGFDPSLPTKVIAHGFWSNVHSSAVQTLKDAYLSAGDYNILALDWSPLVYGLYTSARGDVDGVGDYLGQLLRFFVYTDLIDPKKLHLIGHSLGAHLVGFAGKRAHSDGWGIKRITGLDPAQPLFKLPDHTGRLDRSDADIVDVIHTCADFLGMARYLGDIDFYPNEGANFQPGCTLDVLGICSHGRALQYFAESIGQPTAFIGKYCDSERSDSLVKASHCVGEPTAVMGEHLEFEKDGRYILRTAQSPPFGIGIDSLYPSLLYKQAQRMLRSNSTD